jgi:DUF4097 and DUF4098 domain-containing protein YvlB
LQEHVPVALQRCEAKLKVKDLRGVTHVDPPEISLKVKDTSGAVEGNPSAATVQQPD